MMLSGQVKYVWTILVHYNLCCLKIKRKSIRARDMVMFRNMDILDLLFGIELNVDRINIQDIDKMIKNVWSEEFFGLIIYKII